MIDRLTDADLDAIEQRAHQWASPLSIKCPACGSRPGARCYGNGPMQRSHKERREAARQRVIADVPALLAEVRRLRAMEQRARALHHRDVAVVITGGCAAEDCNHEELGDCDTIEFAYCAGCAALAEQVDCYFSERDFRPVAWPCPTIVALDGGE